MSTSKTRVAVASLVASGALAAAKFAVGVLTGSLGVLSEALNSLVDVGATAITLWAVRIGDQPADDDHTWGHAKFESLASLIQVGLLAALAGWIGIESLRRLLFGGHEVEPSWVAAGVLVLSIVVDFFRARALEATARETGSQALEADSLHFLADMIGSAVVLAGLGLVALGYPGADAAAAFVVACYIGHLAFGLARRTVDVLVDAAPSGAVERISAIADAVDGVVDVLRVRARPAGPTLFVDVAVAIGRTSSLERAAAIKRDVVAALLGDMPEADVTVTTEPIVLDDETVMERVQAVAAALALFVHHVTVQRLGERLAVALDIEVDGRMPLGEAHEVASRLETALRDELGADVEVETHIEPLIPSEMAGEDVAAGERGSIADCLAHHAAATGAVIDDVHSVRVRTTGDGLVVHFHCRTDPALPVREVHDAVDAIEQRLRADKPGIVRVVGHAEPRRTAAAPLAAETIV